MSMKIIDDSEKYGIKLECLCCRRVNNGSHTHSYIDTNYKYCESYHIFTTDPHVIKYCPNKRCAFIFLFLFMTGCFILYT